ncbi:MULTISPECIES: Uma2 family endonuclease [Okeania]|uniref:Uma2 family endonuclease n=1 Tax=Okeania TaxID=1458928 RepID=UPI0030DBA704
MKRCSTRCLLLFGENTDIVPPETSIIDLEKYPPPDLVIEVANSSLSDDQGEKRILYENMGVGEYWIVDVQNVKIIAFSVVDRGSKQIQESLVLPGLKISLLVSLLDEALQRSHHMNQRLVGA